MAGICTIGGLVLEWICSGCHGGHDKPGPCENQGMLRRGFLHCDQSWVYQPVVVITRVFFCPLSAPRLRFLAVLYFYSPLDPALP
jgi:hypothetical protein